jgi:hypothetical protein
MTAYHPAGTMDFRRGRALAAALFIPPITVLGNIEIAYALVPAACASQTSLPLHLINALSLALTIVGGLIAWLSWNALGMGLPEEEGSTLARSRFIAGIAMLLSGLCGLIIVAQWIAVFVLDPCQ